MAGFGWRSSVWSGARRVIASVAVMSAVVWSYGMRTSLAQPPATPPAPATQPIPAPNPMPTLPPPAPPASPQAEADRAVEAYLAERDLDDLLVAQLRLKLRNTTGAERAAIAEKLGKLYVKLLGATRDSAVRQRIEQDSHELLRQVPDAESAELRIDLAKATYMKAAELAERYALRMATPAEMQEAERVLRSVAPTFQEIGSRLHQRVESLERQESLERSGDEVREQLAEARRIRSLAMYFSGWSECYLAVLTGDKQRATKAMQDFGWLLNSANGRVAAVDRLSKGMLRYPHVARAAMGCAVAASVRGNDVDALRWLEAIEESDEIPDEVLPQLFTRRLTVLAAAKRWPDLDLLVRQRRREPGKGEVPLRWQEARLLGVLALEAKNDATLSDRNKEIVESLIQVSWGDLVARGEVGHVLDLTRIYGTAPSGKEGFIVLYVRGLRAFERAAEAHRATGESENDPTADASVKQMYIEAARALGLAPAAADATKFPGERANAIMKTALAHFRAADFEAAATQYQRAGEAAATPDQQQEALWSAILALDRAIAEGKVSRKAERDRLAVLFLKSYPGSDRAAKLLIRRPDGLIDREQSIQVLLSVGPDSPLYLASRQRASNLLLEAYRRAPRTNRDAAASRFIQIADEVAQIDQRQAFELTGPESQKAADRALLRLRQLLEAVLSMSSPDLDRAESALSRIDLLLSQQSRDAGPLKPELAYRRLQIAWARGDLTTADRLMDEVLASGGDFSKQAVREVYQRALAAWTASPRDAGLARALVKVGERIIASLSETTDSAKSAAALSVCNNVAEAAMVVWNAEQDNAARDLALKLDRRIFDAGQPTERSLRRLAELSEPAGDTAMAIQAWRGLLNGLEAGSEEWFEARYHTLRMLAESDPENARQVMAQHKALYPSYGPEPWGVKLQQLDAKLGTASEPVSTTPARDGGKP